MAAYLPSAIVSWWNTPSSADATAPPGLLSAGKLPPPPPTKLDAELAKSAAAHSTDLRHLLDKALASNRKLEQKVGLLEEEVSLARASESMSWADGRAEVLISHTLVSCRSS